MVSCYWHPLLTLHLCTLTGNQDLLVVNCPVLVSLVSFSVSLDHSGHSLLAGLINKKFPSAVLVLRGYFFFTEVFRVEENPSRSAVIEILQPVWHQQSLKSHFSPSFDGQCEHYLHLHGFLHCTVLVFQIKCPVSVYSCGAVLALWSLVKQTG